MLTSWNALKCISSQSKWRDRKNFLLASLAGGLPSQLLPLGLEKFSAALALVFINYTQCSQQADCDHPEFLQFHLSKSPLSIFTAGLIDFVVILRGLTLHAMSDSFLTIRTFKCLVSWLFTIQNRVPYKYVPNSKIRAAWIHFMSIFASFIDRNFKIQGIKFQIPSNVDCYSKFRFIRNRDLL